MSKRVFMSLLYASLFTGNIFAGTMGPISEDWSWVGALSLGPVWQNAGATQTFFLTPDIEKTYLAHKNTTALFYGELFGGIQKSCYETRYFQLGLALAATSQAKLRGDIWDDADPQFDNFNYQYRIQHTHLAAKAKFMADMGYPIMPWVSASLGVGFNRATGFDNQPIIFEAIKNPNFTAHTQTAFTYTLGIGLQKVFNCHWQAGLGYEFADWGKSNLGPAVGQSLNTGLRLNHFYTNGLLLNLTYVT